MNGGIAMKFNSQIFGGGGGSSGGHSKFTGHKMPDKWKQNSSRSRYDKNGNLRETRYFDKNGDKWKDVHHSGPPNHDYPHEHYWWKDDNGNWHRTTYEDWLKGVRR